ncbi:MAG: glutamine--fructose-6-phosphate transaminase (isomerizing) [Spirochaetales bacterium]|nr:glutamine--fructose-6-phosphate transaminase (isomerizing) [Spirochaetales bacterium]
MCGIIGYCGPRNATQILVEGLKRLEYRGYDSAGIAVGLNGSLKVIKTKGKIKELRQKIPGDMISSYGIGHTRWATHGVVNDINAHPHTDCSGNLAIVHNGIIENYESLKNMLESEGHIFHTDTDSEIIAHLIEKYFNDDLEKAVKEALPLLKGTYGIVCIHAKDPGRIVGARNGSPLVVGIGKDEMFLASDVTAIIAHTKKAVYLEDGEVVFIKPEDFITTDINDKKITKEIEQITWELQEIEKDGFPCFMEKEIMEQPESIKRAMSGRIDKELATAHLGGLNLSTKELINLERVKIIAAGTSFYAGMVGAYLLEAIPRIPAIPELASEVRYKNPIIEKNTLYFAVSQSGETIDTLFAMKELQRKGATVLGICNVVGSSIARDSDGGVYIHSGPEIAVASTKAFTSQITVFYLFSLLLARMRDLSFSAGEKLITDLISIPLKVENVLSRWQQLKEMAIKYAHYKDFLFLGRGVNYPVALEGALKLKEISYIHAEGYSSAEIKHGPIALINEETPSVFLVPDDELREKIISNIKEVKARKGKVIAISVEGDEEIKDIVDDVFEIPATHELFYPFIMVVPLQLFAYYCALELGRNVDQPRNLAKSVTVE